MFSREYLFNPFLLKTSDDEELSNLITALAGQYRQSDLIQDVVFNINLEADLLTIYGEFIARLQEDYSLTRLEADNDEAKKIYELRSEWKNLNDEKAPSIDYFKAQASEFVKDKRDKQYKCEAMLTRFKKAYNSLESKQNALKKKLEVFKYE